MTILTPEEATGGKVWKPLLNENLSVKTKVLVTAAIIVWVALGVFLTFGVERIFNISLAGIWDLVTISVVFFGLHLYEIKNKIIFLRNSLAVLSLLAIVLMISAVFLQQGTTYPESALTAHAPANSWILEEANRLTGASDYQLDSLKTYPEDSTHLSAVVDSPTRVDVIELHYIDGQWKAALK